MNHCVLDTILVRSLIKEVPNGTVYSSNIKVGVNANMNEILRGLKNR